MANDIKIMKAVDYDKLPAKFKKDNPFDTLQSKGYWLQPKYDGCFGMAVISREGDSMLSRTGEDYTPSCKHILNEIRACMEELNYDGEDFVVLGEVWHPTDQFPKISGDFRRQRPSPHLCFVANDILPIGLATPIVYSERFKQLRVLLGEPALDEVTKVTTTFVDASTVLDPQGWAAHLKGLGGYDGAILRNPNGAYRIGLVKDGEIIKVKPVMSLDLLVTDVSVETGEKTGRNVYSIEVEYQGVRSWVGSGIPHKARDVPGIGDIAEIECMGLTEDGKLREPRFKGIRFDKLHADT